MARRTLVIGEAEMDAAIERMRSKGGFTFQSTGRQSKGYVCRDGEIFLEHGEDGGLQSSEKVTEQQVREAIAKRPEKFGALLRK